MKLWSKKSKLWDVEINIKIQNYKISNTYENNHDSYNWEVNHHVKRQNYEEISNNYDLIIR